MTKCVIPHLLPFPKTVAFSPTNQALAIEFRHICIGPTQNATRR